MITIPECHTQTDRRTDRQTDGRTTYDGNTALCTKVHRAVKTEMGMLCWILGDKLNDRKRNVVPLPMGVACIIDKVLVQYVRARYCTCAYHLSNQHGLTVRWYRHAIAR